MDVGPASALDAGRPTIEPPVEKAATRYAAALLNQIQREQSRQRRFSEDLRKDLDLEIARLPRFRKLAVTAYRNRSRALLLSDGLTLSAEGHAVIDLLLDVESHGLDGSPYHLGLLKRALAELEAGQKALKEAQESAAMGSLELGRLALVLREFKPGADEPRDLARDRLAAALLARGLDDSMNIRGQIKQVEEWQLRVQDAAQPVARALQAVDVLALGGFFQYVLDFRVLKVAHPFEAMTASQVAQAPKLWRTRLLRALEAADGKLAEAMKALWPPHPFYAMARKAYRRYRAYAKEPRERFGWTVRGTVKKGNKGKRVLALRARLAAEGYEAGALDEPRFGQVLEDAVKAYQRHHQLRDDGIVRNSHGVAGLTRTSLAVGMSSRARQLKLSLQRWRESQTHRVPFYFRVNIPQFEVEVWDQDELVRVHRIIVGNNKFEIDEEHGRKGHLNRTALISNAISRIVINPLWHVPERIKRYEILPAMEKDPDYLEKHNYAVRKLGDGTIQVFQKAGPGNALGRVKLLFPNKHAIYMHDTPKRRLFRRTVRAFSHGCMRLNEPLKMATYLLERQGIMTAREVQKVLATKKERGISLKEKVPIYIEYNTVGFRPDDRQPFFFNDVYKYDKAFYSGEVPMQAEAKIPIVKRESSPLQVDDDGNLIKPEPVPEEDTGDPEPSGGDENTEPVRLPVSPQ